MLMLLFSVEVNSYFHFGVRTKVCEVRDAQVEELDVGGTVLVWHLYGWIKSVHLAIIGVKVN